MAKVTGPLMSLDASGTVANTVVFSKWKGRNYVRQRVVPSNPHSADQEAARNMVRVSGESQRWANINVQLGDGRTLTDKASIVAVTPTGYAWNGYLTDTMIGGGQANFTAAQAAYADLAAGEKTAWDDAADALSPAILAVGQTVAGGGAGTPLSSGNVFFIYQYALAIILGLSAPGAVPPVYA